MSSEENNPITGTPRGRRDKYTWTHQLFRLFWLALIPLGLLLPKLCSGHAADIELTYSRKIYPAIAKVLSAISSAFSFSLAEVLLISAAVIIAAILVFRIFAVIFGKLHKRHRNRIKLVSFLISVGIFAGVMINLFYGLWGLNHFRLPAEYTFGLSVREYSTAELSEAYEYLIGEAAALREQVSEDENGVFTVSHDEVYHSVVEAYETLGESNSAFANTVYPAKSLMLSPAMSSAGIAGIYIPYTAEANVNTDQPDLYIPASTAHETAHYFGFAREDEANFIAYYVSLFSEDPALRYSAVMNALVCCGNALCEQDRELYIAMRERYTDGMNRDLTEYRNYLANSSGGKLEDISDKLNDTYLKHNGQTEGVDSYYQMTRLLLAYFEARQIITGG